MSQVLESLAQSISDHAVEDLKATISNRSLVLHASLITEITLLLYTKHDTGVSTFHKTRLKYALRSLLMSFRMKDFALFYHSPRKRILFT